LRQPILWQDLDALLGLLPDRPLRVLDAGGGEGQTARRIAQRGHQGGVGDLSAEMIARAQKAAQDKGGSGNMHFRQCAPQEAGPDFGSPGDFVFVPPV
ncbi:methyltransferase domain-containing protein, partial [Cronobacter sakazakii]|uniref:methyltransferase domain-containing protein n=1 Tax=Cronobacter sakazakii TaxID=28141 RepID=UPI000D4DE083